MNHNSPIASLPFSFSPFGTNNNINSKKAKTYSALKPADADSTQEIQKKAQTVWYCIMLRYHEHLNKKTNFFSGETSDGYSSMSTFYSNDEKNVANYLSQNKLGIKLEELQEFSASFNRKIPRTLSQLIKDFCDGDARVAFFDAKPNITGASEDNLRDFLQSSFEEDKQISVPNDYFSKQFSPSPLAKVLVSQNEPLDIKTRKQNMSDLLKPDPDSKDDLREKDKAKLTALLINYRYIKKHTKDGVTRALVDKMKFDTELNNCCKNLNIKVEDCFSFAENTNKMKVGLFSIGHLPAIPQTLSELILSQYKDNREVFFTVIKEIYEKNGHAAMKFLYRSFYKNDSISGNRFENMEGEFLYYYYRLNLGKCKLNTEQRKQLESMKRAESKSFSDDSENTSIRSVPPPVNGAGMTSVTSPSDTENDIFALASAPPLDYGAEGWVFIPGAPGEHYNLWQHRNWDGSLTGYAYLEPRPDANPNHPDPFSY